MQSKIGMKKSRLNLYKNIAYSISLDVIVHEF